ncbi:MAG: RNB domain-containing ribonuclease [Bryobacteraceae bacterium]
MSPVGFDLAASAREEMLHEGFHPDFPPGTEEQLIALRGRPAPLAGGDVEDLRALLWSSIDNDSSRDLDQIEYAERAAGGIRVLIGIADVDSDVAAKTPIDGHASEQTTTVYTEVRTFPMLPEELSTDLTSLNENVDRLAVVVDFTVAADGSIGSSAIRRALVRNKAQLTYDGVGCWLEGTVAAPAKVAASADLQAQLRLQDAAAGALREKRHELGALDFDRTEAHPVISNGVVTGIAAHRKNKASALIEDFMVAANEVMARTLTEAGVASIRRVVKVPERWPRIVDLAAQHGAKLPGEPDSGALAAFLAKQKLADPVHYEDLSLAVIKLMGPGEYVVLRPGETSPGHFGLAAPDYTHSTAPNRRFADLVTQRLIKAVLAKQSAPYAEGELDSIASNCTSKEDGARKVERTMQKRVAAVALAGRIGQSFAAVVTGVTPKGVFVRVFNPPVEGRLMRGEHGLDVGDQLRVTLLSTDPQRGFIDFGRG